MWIGLFTLPKALPHGSVAGEGANEYSLERVRPWTEVRIHPSIHAHIISGLNILFLAQTPLLHVLFQHIIIPEVNVLFVEFRSFFLTYSHFNCRILSRQTFTRFL